MTAPTLLILTAQPARTLPITATAARPPQVHVPDLAMVYAATLTDNLYLWEQTPAWRLFPCTYLFLLDFRVPPLRLKVQSTALSRSFCTSSCLPSTSKSNPPLFLAPPRKKGGLQRNPPILIRQSQSTSPILHQPIPPSKAPAISATSESGTRTYLPSGTNHFPIGLSAPALTASTANFFPATQKNIIAASIAPSGQI